MAVGDGDDPVPGGRDEADGGADRDLVEFGVSQTKGTMADRIRNPTTADQVMVVWGAS